MPAPQPSHYYIYYPIRLGQEGDLARVLDLIQADLSRGLGIRGRYLRKADDPWTWMEIYENVPDPTAFETALASALEAHGFARFLEEGRHRHVERFIPCV